MKKVKWLIQDVNLRYSQLEKIYNALEKLNYDFEPFGVIPFTKNITNLENILEENTKYIIIGGTKVLTIFENIVDIQELNDLLTEDQIKFGKDHLKNLKSGLFYDINKFDQAAYKHLNLPLLNKDAIYLKAKENLSTSFDELKFIKPSRDLKAFNGGILEIGQTIEEFVKNTQYQDFWIDEEIVIASCKKIYSEYRFFVVNKEVITCSRYKLGDKVSPSSEVPQDILDAAKKYALLYQPHEIFTLDIADTPDGYKIVEYNCWNASGTYDCDLNLIYSSVQRYIEKI